MPHLLEQASVLHGDGDVAAQSLQNLQLLRSKCVKLWMGGGEDSDELFVYQQGDGDFEERGLLAWEVVRVFSDVWRVSHLAGGRSISDQSFLAQFQAMTLVMHGATVDASQDEFLAGRFVEVDVCFDQTEGARYLIHYAIDKFIQIEK